MKLEPTPPYTVEVFLQPGEFYWGDEGTRIRTILGSCVAITVWHPGKMIGGMCHYLLSNNPSEESMEMDPRYGGDAIALILREIRKARTEPAEYHVKMFGGANMFPGIWGSDIGRENIMHGKEHLARYGFSIRAAKLGGLRHHSIIFDLWTGNVWVKLIQ
ncbi:MAG: chemotaxis protein CheD [Spirochaetes bacterium]|nr:MAG: chemotaxis protein CheD [Spirochaetota bacterium]